MISSEGLAEAPVGRIPVSVTTLEALGEGRGVVGPIATEMGKIPTTWSGFMHLDPRGGPKTFGSDGLLCRKYPDCVLIAQNEQTGEVVGSMFSAPFYSPDGFPRSGWDGVLDLVLAALRQEEDGETPPTPNMISALDATVHARFQGQGVGTALIRAARFVAAEKGFRSLWAPARPVIVPTPVGNEYVPLDTDGNEYDPNNPGALPADPWLRAHVLVGGKFRGVIAESMRIALPAAEWRRLGEGRFRICPDDPNFAEMPGALVRLRRDPDILDNPEIPDSEIIEYCDPNASIEHVLDHEIEIIRRQRALGAVVLGQ